MKIIMLSEGKTERVCGIAFKRFVDEHCRAAEIPRVSLVVKPFDGPVTNCERIRRRVSHYVKDNEVVGVILLTDVYPEFKDATEAKQRLRDCVSGEHYSDKIHTHAAQYEFEAWLLPFWDDIARRLGVRAKTPGSNPEQVNDQSPPSDRLNDLYARAHRKYQKAVEAPKILRRHRIEEAAEKCPELRSLLETLTTLCDKCAA